MSKDTGNELNSTSQTSFDKQFAVGDGVQFYGSSSVFALTSEIVAHAQETLQDFACLPSKHYAESTGQEETVIYRSFQPIRESVESLVALYMRSTNVLFDFVDEATLPEDIEGYIEASDKMTAQHSPIKTHQFFRINMMCAIASVNKARHHPAYHAESLNFYCEASRYVEEVTSEASAESLQALLLLCIFCLFYPRKGDIWKLLDYACRLSVELGYHTEQAVGTESNNQCQRRRRTFWGLYTIERIVGQLFGRPSDLAEEIITTEYPWTVSETRVTDKDHLQSILVAHQYRLVYLRSEIYRELYTPAEPPNLPLEWYRTKFMAVLDWRSELQSAASDIGVGSLIVDIGYHCTVAFLFQPLMLRVLSNTRSPAYINEAEEIVPLESYLSACEIVRIYNQILCAPENSPLGIFPMTFVSAHYVFVAVMTIIAHCLLALDGRVSSIELSPIESAGSKAVEFDNLFEISSGAVVVLAWCAERWPGMIGMLDIYRKLSDRILPVMTKRGFVG